MTTETTEPAQPGTGAEEQGEPSALYQIADGDLACAHPSCASARIVQGSSYFSSHLGPMHPQCSWQSIPLG